jgi:N-acetylmuramoyl-L-alanine amidase
LRAVVGHRDLSPDLDHDGVVEPHEWVKQCPCFDAIPEYGALLKDAA